MATSITTFSGLRCTRIPRTQFFTATATSTSTSAATETPAAALPDVLSSFSTTTVQDTSSTSLLSSIISQQTDSSPSEPTSSLASFVTTAVAASSTLTAAATILPAVTSPADPSSSDSSSSDPSSSDNSSADSSGDSSKGKVIAAAVGASLGAVAIVALFILCAYITRRKRRTPSQIGDREKDPGTTGRFSGITQLIDKIRSGPGTAFIPAVVDKVRPALARVRNFRSTSREAPNDTPAEQTQTEPFRRGSSPGWPFPHQDRMQEQDITSAPRIMPEPTNPFADPPASVNIATNRNDYRPENPFTDPAKLPPVNIAPNRNNNEQPENPFADSEDPFSHSDYEDEPAFTMPLTIRNGDADRNDIVDDNTNDNDNNRGQHSNRSTLSGSTYIPNSRASSPLVYDFNFLTWKSDGKLEDRSSTYSDPFDLERPPTIHSSAFPTPMVERQKSQKGGYFPEMNQNIPQYIS
ncbi:conserved hypothetical protein [Talaromyces stipitatus ATCC 10500]|uniref:Uncharacterized protein n=1 Tax=Talaromyces stipitatus (strain ATCC 10500 / CBS 375.48 / QM 6759 / NRRL 1006) TaxID=441959 RepID=B8M1D0_TALSN|nr:uncharacterized protein TSTA_090650 [Talaromyces stipitatus ATCC 10500]EED21826.1 conserved hypothetical protein [Talaromyces stipitatus ATCC 10500]